MTIIWLSSKPFWELTKYIKVVQRKNPKMSRVVQLNYNFWTPFIFVQHFSLGRLPCVFKSCLKSFKSSPSWKLLLVAQNCPRLFKFNCQFWALLNPKFLAIKKNFLDKLSLNLWASWIPELITKNFQDEPHYSLVQ